MTPRRELPPAVFTVAKGTPVARCRSCQRVVFWIVTGMGKRMPVDCSPEKPLPGIDPAALYPPTRERDGQGVSHFATCPDAGQWRKP